MKDNHNNGSQKRLGSNGIGTFLRRSLERDWNTLVGSKKEAVCLILRNYTVRIMGTQKNPMKQVGMPCSSSPAPVGSLPSMATEHSPYQGSPYVCTDKTLRTPAVPKNLGSQALAARSEILVSDSSNNIRDEDRSIHDWYRFVLSFPPHLVREYLARLGSGQDGLILDPFCGTGTTLVEAMKLRHSSVGFEASPMAHFASATKTDWSPEPQRLIKTAERIASIADAELQGAGISDIPDQSTPTSPLRTLVPDAAKLLIRDSISPLPLHKVLVLIDAIKSQYDADLHDHLMLAVARILPTMVGNLKFGPEVGLGKIKPDAAVISKWLDVVAMIAGDLRDLPRTPDSRVVLGDARDPAQYLEKRSIGAIFTSPPYPNEKDYTRTTRLESVLLGLYGDMAQLRGYKQNLLRSNTRNIYKGDNDSRAIAGFESVITLAQEIEQRRLDLGKTSGFEKNYHKVVLQYFGGMALHLEGLRPFLQKGATLSYVVGDQASFFRIMIRTGHLLAEIAERLGYNVESIDLFRTRLATATKAQLREEVLVLRWNH